MNVNLGCQGSVVFSWHLPMPSSFPLKPRVIAEMPYPGQGMISYDIWKGGEWRSGPKLRLGRVIIWF